MLAEAIALDKRKEQLKSRRTVVEEEWRDCFRYSFPLLGSGFESMGVVSGDATQQNASNAQANAAELYDSTGTESADILAAALVAGGTPSNSRWIGIDAGDETDEEKRWLDEVAEAQWENTHASNYDAVNYDAMLHLVVAGMFPMFCDEAPGGGYHFELWPLANCYAAASVAYGPVDTVFNEFPMSAEQAVKAYGTKVSEKLRKIYDKTPDAQVTMVRCVYPRMGSEGYTRGKLARNLPFASVHYELDTKHIVRESGYHELPIGMPRWNTIPGSAYAFGQLSKVLPDLRTLNDVKRYDLANADMHIAGMYGAVDDGVLDARNVVVGPRKVVVMAEKDNFWRMDAAGDLQYAALKTAELQAQVRRVMLADQLTPQGGPVRSATEVAINAELIRQQLGPQYGRLVAEYIQWLFARSFGVAYRAGVYAPPPRSLLKRALSMRYMSPIARAQKLQEVAAMDRYEATLGAQIQAGLTDAADVYEWDMSRRERAELLGVPAKLIPDQDLIDERREQRKQAAAQAQQQQTMAGIAGEAIAKAA